MYQLKKKDGTTERFDRFKIISGAMRAGATAEQAEKAVQKVETYVMFNAPKTGAEKSKVRDQVMKSLSQENPIAARIYGVFEKK
jgi:transcriptional regulator NrdR family protein